MSANTELATLFTRMADVLDLLGENRFKVAAYQRGARVLEELTENVAQLAETDRLTEVQGIGKGLAEKIVEYIETGRIAEIEAAMGQVPAGVLELLTIPGLGPKSVASLWKQGGVTSPDDLKKKLTTGELETLPRMGKKTLENIAKSLAFAESGGKRVRLGDAMPIAHAFIEQLRKLRRVVRIDYAGSLRRGVETIGDVDLVASCRDPGRDGPAITEAFRTLPMVDEVIASAPTKTSVRISPGMQVDMRIVSDDAYGAALLYFTGSKAHNIAMRERAIKRGLRLNEYGLWREDDESHPVASKNEQDVYKALGLTWLPPEMREDRGELAVSMNGKVPKLLEVSDIKAELHAHTVASDGSWTIEELATAAKARGFHTVAVTDHSVSQPIAHGLSIERLEKHIVAVRKANERIKGITILAGSEVDILPDGRLDYPDSLLAQLDIVVASPHMSLNQDPEKATARLLKAMENPYVHILGHPTGRLVLRREGLSPDISVLVKAAAETGTALEINANSYRLDLRDTHARAAIEAGVMLAINCDAHGPADLDQLPYGVLTARRAWVEPKHVVNCLTEAKLRNWLEAKRLKMS